jgi:beta-glucanase (GH16 family)
VTYTERILLGNGVGLNDWLNQSQYCTFNNESAAINNPECISNNIENTEFYFNIRKKHNDGWFIHPRTHEKEYGICKYQSSYLLSNKKFSYGQFDILVKIPRFMGSYTNISLIDFNRQMPIIGIVSQKTNSFLSKYRTEFIYKNSSFDEYNKKHYLINLSKFNLYTLIWKHDEIVWKVNGIKVYKLLNNDVKMYDFLANIFINFTLINWKEKPENYKSLIIKEIKYTQF